jgi:DNA-binding IclR family transcriptional regulator
MRVIGLFEAIAKAEDGLTLADLAQQLESPKSSLLTLLRPLVASDHLAHREGRYRLGPAAFRLGKTLLGARREPEQLRAAMRWLAERSGETVILTAIDRAAGMVNYVETIESRNAVRYVPAPGSSRPLYTSAAGRALLAWQEPAWVEAYLKGTPLKKVTERSVTSLPELRRILERTRQEGAVVTSGETIVGASGCAAPVFDEDGKVRHALLIGAPSDRFDPVVPRMMEAVREAARRASASAPPLPAPEAKPVPARRPAATRRPVAARAR